MDVAAVKIMVAVADIKNYTYQGSIVVF